MSAGKLARIRHIALDLDGTVYRGGTLFNFTKPFLQLLDRLGIGYTFLTNNSSKSTVDYLEHLRQLEIAAAPGQVYTSTHSTIEYLREVQPDLRDLFVLGTTSLAEEFQQAGFHVTLENERPQTVVVGYDPNLPFHRLCKAAWWISTRIPYIATHPDRICPTDQPTVLIDCGSVCACLESATGIAPAKVLGKPDPRMLTGLMRVHNLDPAELIMAGDRIYTDMVMARRAGAVSVLVLTGEATRADAAGCEQPPDFILPSLAELGQLLEESRDSNTANLSEKYKSA